MTLFTFAEKGGVDSGTILLTGILLLAIFMPTSFFFAYQIHKRRKAIPIKVRYPSLTFWFTSFFCLKLCCSGSICLLLWKYSSFSDHMLYKPLLIVDNISFYTFIYLMIYRLWCIKYDLNWSKATLREGSWRQLIDPNSSSDHQSWYMTHKATCCCPSYLCPFIVWLLIISADIVPIILYGYTQSITTWIDRCLFTFLIIIMLILYIITPKQMGGRAPKFELKKELRMVFIINIIMLLICVSGFVYDLYYANKYEAFEIYNERNTNVLIEESLKFAAEWFLCMFQTFYVLIKTGEYIPFYTLRRTKRGATHVLGVMDGSNTRQLSEMLNNEKLFPWFVAHLASEFSLNVICALIEFVQFQRYCFSFWQSHSSDYIQLKSDNIRLPPNLPQSAIVFENAALHSKSEMDFFFSYALEKYHKLYCKYFHNKGSKLQLAFTPNIKQYFDGMMANEHTFLYANTEINALSDLVVHLDKSISEIYHLADDSFQRFLDLNRGMLFKQIPELYMPNLSA